MPNEIGISHTAYKAMYEKLALIIHFAGKNVINNATVLDDLDTASAGVTWVKTVPFSGLAGANENGSNNGDFWALCPLSKQKRT